MSIDFAEMLRAAIAEGRERAAIADAYVALLRRQGELWKSAAAVYRCEARGCTLLIAIPTPQGIIVHQPAYKLSPSINEASSSDAGRARNTSDGNRHWIAKSFFLSDSENNGLNCDHVRNVVVSNGTIETDVARHAGAVTV